MSRCPRCGCRGRWRSWRQGWRRAQRLLAVGPCARLAARPRLENIALRARDMGRVFGREIDQHRRGVRETGCAHVLDPARSVILVEQRLQSREDLGMILYEATRAVEPLFL